MELKLIRAKVGLTADKLENEGFIKIMRYVYLNQDEIAYKIGPIYKKVLLKDVSECRIERRIRHYNLHIEGTFHDTTVYYSTLPEVQEAASKISDAASKKGYDVNVVLGCMKVNLKELCPLPDWEECDGCMEMLLWPFLALAYHTVLPLANMILRIFIK